MWVLTSLVKISSYPVFEWTLIWIDKDLPIFSKVFGITSHFACSFAMWAPTKTTVFLFTSVEYRRKVFFLGNAGPEFCYRCFSCFSMRAIRPLLAGVDLCDICVRSGRFTYTPTQRTTVFITRAVGQSKFTLSFSLLRSFVRAPAVKVFYLPVPTSGRSLK